MNRSVDTILRIEKMVSITSVEMWALGVIVVERWWQVGDAERL
jgi:hypothetical protein